MFRTMQSKMGQVHLEIGDKVRVVADRKELYKIGIVSEDTYKKLLSDRVWTVHDIVINVTGALIYLQPREDGILWVYDYLCKKVG